MESLLKLTKGNTSTPWEPHDNTGANSFNSLGVDDAQEEAHLPIQTSDPFEQEGHYQAHPNSTQEFTVEDGPIALRT